MTDAVYYSVDNDSIDLLRFYSSGVVIGVPVKSSIDRINHILSWFKIETYNSMWSKGPYVFNGKDLQFELKSTSGIVVYHGEIQSDKSLILNTTSRINGHKSIKYFTLYSNIGEIEVNFSKSEQLPHELFSTGNRQNKELSDANSLPAAAKSNSNFWTYIFLMLFLFGCITYATRKREGCQCWDGTSSYAVGSGACSYHHGVMYWKHHYWWDD